MNNGTPQYIVELNQKHGVVMIGGRCLILNEILDPVLGHQTFSLSSPHDLRLFYDNRRAPGQSKRKNIAQAWLQHPQRRQFEGIMFAPGQDVPGYYNIYHGLAVTPKPGDCNLYLTHLRENISQDDPDIYDYFVRWMAQTVQEPGERPGVAIALRGDRGTGKGVFCTEFAKLFGAHWVHVQHRQHLVGNFNAHLSQAIVVFADEAFWAGDHTGESALKALITEERLPVEFKGRDIFYVKNHIRLLMASNNNWLVPAGLDERRFFIVDVGDKHKQDHPYFAAIKNQMNNGGREALLHYLMNINLDGVNLRIYPQTAALMENKILTMTPVEKFWYEKLVAGSLDEKEDEWNRSISRSRLQDQYETFTKNAGVSRRSTATELGMGLRKLCPEMKSYTSTDLGQRVAMYIFPELSECRDAFDKIIKQKHEWPEKSMALKAEEAGNGRLNPRLPTVEGSAPESPMDTERSLPA